MDVQQVVVVEEFQPPRRSLRRLALSELNETPGPQNTTTPNKSTSPDEMVIIQRGPRRKPLTWSPVEYCRGKIMGPPREKTPEPNEKTPNSKGNVNPRLRRRLILSPTKNASEELGNHIARKLRALQKSRDLKK